MNSVQFRRGFTLFEVLIAMTTMAVATLSTLLIIPMGLEAQRVSRQQLVAASLAQTLVSSIGAKTDHYAGTYGRLYEDYASAVNQGPRGPDIEGMQNVSWLGSLVPLPPRIAARLDSDNDEIASILDQGGQLYFPTPSGTLRETKTTTGEYFDRTYISTEDQKLIVGIVGYRQNNAMGTHPQIRRRHPPMPQPIIADRTFQSFGDYRDKHTNAFGSGFNFTKMAEWLAARPMQGFYSAPTLKLLTKTSVAAATGIIVPYPDASSPLTHSGGAPVDKFPWFALAGASPYGYPASHDELHTWGESWRNFHDTDQTFPYIDTINDEYNIKDGSDKDDHERVLAKTYTALAHLLSDSTALAPGSILTLVLDPSGASLLDAINWQGWNTSTKPGDLANPTPAEINDIANNWASIYDRINTWEVTDLIDRSGGTNLYDSDDDLSDQEDEDYLAAFHLASQAAFSALVLAHEESVASGTPWDGNRPSDQPSYARFQVLYELALRLQRAVTINYPNDYRMPSASTLQLMTALPLMEYDVFSPYNYGIDDPREKHLYSMLSARPIRGTRSEVYPVDISWPLGFDLRQSNGSTTSGTFGSDAPWIADGWGDGSDTTTDDPRVGKRSQWTLTKPFDSAERTRQIVVWSVNWQSYEDFESAPAALMDSSMLPRHPWGTETIGQVSNQNDNSGPTYAPLNRFGTVAEGPFCWNNIARTKLNYQYAYRSGIFNSAWFNGWPIEPYLGRYGADRNGNQVFDQGDVPADTRMRAVTVARFNVYDPRLYVQVQW